MSKRLEYFHEETPITGKHSRLIDDMWEQNQIQNSYFKRLVDLYTIAPIIGIRMKRKAAADHSEDSKRTVPVTQMLNKIDDLKLIMQTVLLLDNTSGLTIEQRVDRAFKDPQNEDEFNQNVEIFNSYVRGGIEVLHELLVQRALGINDEFSDVRVGNIMALFDNPLIPDILS